MPDIYSKTGSKSDKKAPSDGIIQNEFAASDDSDKGAIAQVEKGRTTDEIDNAILKLNGHEAVLERRFSWVSALGLAFSITNSWVGFLSNFGQNLIYGGPQVVIFGLIVAFFAQYTITLGLSELASAYPSSGGQYHFCYILAPPKTKRFAAYITGWMSLLAWLLVTASGISLAAVCTAGLVHFFHPEYEAATWHIWLVYVAHITKTVKISLYLSLIGFVLWFIVALAMKQESQPPSSITQSGLGTSGWPDRTAWLLGVSNAMYTFGGTDGVIHISEEIHQPGRRVPQVMSLTMFMGLLTSLPIFLVLMFYVRDLDALTSAPLASLEAIYQTTGSRVATSFLVIWLLSIYITCLSAQWVTSGRIAWAFARDGGLPFSNYFSHIDERKAFPVRTTIAAFVFVCIYGLLYLASTTAFNSIVTSAVLFLNISFAIPQGILLFQGRNKLPTRYLNLGYLGYFCNGFAIVWIVVLGTTVCMPPSLPVSVGNMNYSSVCLVGLMSIVLLFWFTLGKNFRGPDIDWEGLRAANIASLT
ncbi:amino acid transporter [Byssothecium circinans]|uniref:Amino acid transporter n=1 Tax=Byssothecium circinans TaxID=147558 RepID=A0A6A5TGE8_9PLEO|nr:amino acid transporter [Byssothecium circinans]